MQFYAIKQIPFQVNNVNNFYRRNFKFGLLVLCAVFLEFLILHEISCTINSINGENSVFFIVFFCLTAVC